MYTGNAPFLAPSADAEQCTCTRAVHGNSIWALGAEWDIMLRKPTGEGMYNLPCKVESHLNFLCSLSPDAVHVEHNADGETFTRTADRLVSDRACDFDYTLPRDPVFFPSAIVTTVCWTFDKQILPYTKIISSHHKRESSHILRRS